MKPLFTINANSFPDNILWVCVYYSDSDNNQSSHPFHRKQYQSIFYEYYDFDYAFKKNARYCDINFCGVNSTGSNPSNGIYVYTVKAKYPNLSSGIKKETKLSYPI